MKHVDAKEFWNLIDSADRNGLRGTRPFINIELNEHGAHTEVMVGGRLLGEEITCYTTKRTRCYINGAF